MANKQCTKCKTVYDDIESNFYRNGKRFRLECKTCTCKYEREHYQLPEVKEKTEEYYEKNREYIAECVKEYRKTPKGRAVRRASDAKLRANKLQQVPDYANFKLILKIYEHCPENYEVDHMVSISRGGLHHESNLCYLPSNINYQKRAKSIEEFGVDKFNKHVVYWQNIL